MSKPTKDCDHNELFFCSHCTNEIPPSSTLGVISGAEQIRVFEVTVKCEGYQDQQSVSDKEYWPKDLHSQEALCLRIDHMHTLEAGCWEPRPRNERIKESEDNWPEPLKHNAPKAWKPDATRSL